MRNLKIVRSILQTARKNKKFKDIAALPPKTYTEEEKNRARAIVEIERTITKRGSI